jgi:hypothetical protein
VVDGQHRLWAQKFSQKDGRYACIIHLGKTEKEMAELFLEINENQRRVPSSLRWDLVRLVRPAGDESGIMAAELVLALVDREDSPFHISIDLTGEQKELTIKQGSLAPEIKTLVTRTKRSHDATFDDYLALPDPRENLQLRDGLGVRSRFRCRVVGVHHRNPAPLYRPRDSHLSGQPKAHQVPRSRRARLGAGSGRRSRRRTMAGQSRTGRARTAPLFPCPTAFAGMALTTEPPPALIANLRKAESSRWSEERRIRSSGGNFDL